MSPLIGGFLSFILAVPGFAEKPMTVQEYKLNILKIAQKNKKDVRACLKKVEKKDKKVKGKVIIVWEVDEKGRARNVTRAEDTINESDLYHCLEKKIEKWKFPKPPQARPLDVEHEFVF